MQSLTNLYKLGRNIYEADLINALENITQLIPLIFLSIPLSAKKILITYLKNESEVSESNIKKFEMLYQSGTLISPSASRVEYSPIKSKTSDSDHPHHEDTTVLGSDGTSSGTKSGDEEDAIPDNNNDTPPLSFMRRASSVLYNSLINIKDNFEGNSNSAKVWTAQGNQRYLSVNYKYNIRSLFISEELSSRYRDGNGYISSGPSRRRKGDLCTFYYFSTPKVYGWNFCIIYNTCWRALQDF